jgi:hypothetical protein
MQQRVAALQSACKCTRLTQVANDDICASWKILCDGSFSGEKAQCSTLCCRQARYMRTNEARSACNKQSHGAS